jgi:PRTRC genetic system protein B
MAFLKVETPEREIHGSSIRMSDLEPFVPWRMVILIGSKCDHGAFFGAFDRIAFSGYNTIIGKSRPQTDFSTHEGRPDMADEGTEPLDSCREDSKSSQAFCGSGQSGAAEKAAAASADLSGPPAANRHRLPSERSAITHHFMIAGHEGYLTVGLYRDNRSSFVTRHDVTAQKDAPPMLGPAQPLTLTFVESLVRSLGGSAMAEVLPESVLAKGDRMIAWWTPARRQQMFYENSEGKAVDLDGRLFPQPPLLWKVAYGELSIRALVEDRRPKGPTTLAVAPFWNLSDDGQVCTGTMRRPDSVSVAAIPAWEQGFYESAFTHANVGRLTRHEGGFKGLWSSLAGKRTGFPLDTLITLPQTLAQFVRGERF